MIKTLLAQVKEFKKASFLTPVFMILEVVVETMIPLVMADMIDNGVEAGNISYLYRNHTSDYRCDQPAECIPDDPAYVYPCPGQSDLCHGDGVYDQCKGCQHLPYCRYFSWMFSRIYYEKGD